MSCTWLLPPYSLQKENGVMMKELTVWVLAAQQPSGYLLLLLTKIIVLRSWARHYNLTAHHIERPNKKLFPGNPREIGLASHPEKEAILNGNAPLQKAAKDKLQQCGLLWPIPCLMHCMLRYIFHPPQPIHLWLTWGLTLAWMLKLHSTAIE